MATAPATPAAGACPYANICEQCDNCSPPPPEFGAPLENQLADVHLIHDDPCRRGWDSEAARHDRVWTSVESHTRRLRAATVTTEFS